MIIPKEQIMWEVFCKFKQGYKLLDYKKRWQQPNGENMTDEEIIIDGVDVSECVSFDKLNGLNICCYDDTREDKIPFANFCIENKDCYFKQLKCKEQECESQKQRLEYYREKTTQLLNDIDNKDRFNTELQEKIEKLEQELLYAKNIASDILSNNCNIGYARQEVAKILYTR